MVTRANALTAAFIAMVLAFAALGAALAHPAQAYAAGSQSMWVLDKVSADSGYATSSYAYAYNKSGLVTNVAMASTGGKETTTWKYNAKGNYTGCVYKYNGGATKYKLKLDKNKRVSSYWNTDKKSGGEVWKVKYNAKGKCVKLGTGWKLAYDAKGNMTKYGSKSFSVAFTRDAHGTIVKSVRKLGGSSISSEFTNTYDAQGLLTYQAQPDGASASFTYKQVSVPKKLAAKVKAQQRMLLDRCSYIGFAQTSPLFVVNK